mmetsp:Transcript_36723/g.46829  ORF Transcript_36723/g.46829 Transcript_36723/m.46829 type:complete len:267 (+) Transcript_36723:161-961(+)
MDSSPVSYRFRVQGTPFEVSPKILYKLQSDVLNKIVDDSSGFLIPEDGIFELDGVQPESFHVLIGFAMNDELILPSSLDLQRFLNDADFLGIKDTCLEKLISEKERISLKQEDFLDQTKVLFGRFFDQSFDLGIAKGKSTLHHNDREDDGSGRIYCKACRNRDFDSRYFRTDSVYIHATKCCKREIMYNKSLGWCHKCQTCENCQGSECPNDNNVGCYRSRYSIHLIDFGAEKVAIQERAFAELGRTFLNRNSATTSDKNFMESGW